MEQQENIAAAQPVVETDTTQPSSPQGKEPTTAVQTTSTEALSDEFPIDQAEQRRAFQEMRQELKALKEERGQRTKSESAFAPFRPAAPAYVDPNQYVDPTTGETNWQGYTQAREQQIQAGAVQAAQDMVDEQMARQKHPDLFADPEVEEEIAAKWLWAKTHGQNVTVSELSDKIAQKYSKAVSKGEQAGAQRMLAEVGAKEQAGLEPAGQSGTVARQVEASADFEQLRVATRYGKEDAIAARMRTVQWANK